MNFEHHLTGSFKVEFEMLLQHRHDKFHRGVVVVEQDHLTVVGQHGYSAIALFIGQCGISLLGAMSDETNHVQTRHTLLMQAMHGLGVIFTKYRDQHIGACDFPFVATDGLHVHDRSLEHSLKTGCWAGINFTTGTNGGNTSMDRPRQTYKHLIQATNQVLRIWFGFEAEGYLAANSSSVFFDDLSQTFPNPV